MKKRVCFFVQTDNPKIIEYVEFYKIDIQILQDLGFEVVPCFSFKNIPHDVDFYFIWWWTYAIFPLLKAKLLRKKTIITGTFNLNTPIDGQGFYSRPFYQRLMIAGSVRLSDANIIVSRYEYERLVRDIPGGKFFYSPHVLEADKYVNHVSGVRQNYVFTISWMSKLSAKRKCIPQIIKAAHILKKQGHHIPFFIAGKVEKDALFLKEISQELGLGDMVVFLGSISEEEKIRRLYRCGIYLQPSIFEGFGLAIAEAMICGAPVVTSKVGAVPEVTGDLCVYANGDDPKQIANAIIDTFRNYEHHLQLARRAQNHVKANFGYERRLNDFKKVFQTLELCSQ